MNLVEYRKDRMYSLDTIRTVIRENLKGQRIAWRYSSAYDEGVHFNLKTFHRNLGANPLAKSVFKRITELSVDHPYYEMREHLNSEDFKELYYSLGSTLAGRRFKRILARRFGIALTRCDDCGEFFDSSVENVSRSYDYSNVCEECIELHYTWSDHLDTYVHSDNAVEFYVTADDYRNGDSTLVHEIWANHYAYDYNGCLVSGDAYSDLTYEDDDYDEDDDDEENSIRNTYNPATNTTLNLSDPILGYHSSKRVVGHIPSKYDDRKPRLLLGLELEMEIADSQTYASAAAKNVLQAVGLVTAPNGTVYRYGSLERDGSLNNGFELVTSYTGLDVHRIALEPLKQDHPFHDAFRPLRSHNTRTCGLHVHIDKAGMTGFHRGKLLLFVNSPANEALLRAICRRYPGPNGEYAKITPKLLKDGREMYNSDRYEALNFQNDRTIEFRLPRGTLRYETVMAVLEFTYCMWLFTKETEPEGLVTSRFTEWISRPANREDSKFLRAYLTEKGLMAPEKVSAMVDQSNIVEPITV